MQRKIQKERDQEGEVFADKEAYVTQAYRKKMQEMQEEEEKEMRRQRVEGDRCISLVVGIVCPQVLHLYQHLASTAAVLYARHT